MSTTLALFVKAPTPGRVKTRLAATLGEARAVEVYRELVASTCAALAAARADRVVVYYGAHVEAPSEGLAAVRAMCAQPLWIYRPQVEGDLGQRMRAAFGELLEESARVVLVGSDCPDLSPELLEGALDALVATPMVLGPSRDGGYYLIGLGRFEAALFEGIAWSTERVLAQTQERAAALEIEPALLVELNDIDTEADYRAWRAVSP